MKAKLMELLENMDAEDLRNVSNEYDEVVCCYDDVIYRMDEFDDVFQGVTPTDIAKRILGEDFSLDDDYFVFTIYGIESFSRFNLINYVDIEEVVEYIIENKNCLGNSDVDDMLKEYGENDWCVIRTNENLQQSSKVKICYNRFWTGL